MRCDAREATAPRDSCHDHPGNWGEVALSLPFAMRMEWDAALAAVTARALDQRLKGARIRAVLLDAEARRFVIWLREMTLVWQLHPEERGLLILDASDPPPEARPLPAKVRRIRAPADDRLIVIETLRVRGKPSQVDIVLELMSNQENVLMLEGGEQTIRLLLRTREGNRPLRRGHPYPFPPASDRDGIETPILDERWAEIWGVEERRERRKALLGLAWMSALLADALLEFDRWQDARDLWLSVRDIATAPVDASASADPDAAGPRGALLEGRWGAQPWILPLNDRTLQEVPDLLDAFRLATERSEASTVLLPTALLERFETHVSRLKGRTARLEEEFAALGDADAERSLGDLILARYHEVGSGRTEVELKDFEGNPVRIELDPKLAPDANARRYYASAARIERAHERLPALISESRAAWEAAELLLERARSGEADRTEVESALPANAEPGNRKGDAAPLRPYRVYRASSGREIRVGRGAAKNDDLTFRHSAPNDIWLHARHTAGAHVILRWGRDENPDPRDLVEAGILAALNSKARTSGSVPVDWTFRKHVRKPRKAPPGAVIPDQVKTVFVEPDEKVEKRLREE